MPRPRRRQARCQSTRRLRIGSCAAFVAPFPEEDLNVGRLSHAMSYHRRRNGQIKQEMNIAVFSLAIVDRQATRQGLSLARQACVTECTTLSEVLYRPNFAGRRQQTSYRGRQIGIDGTPLPGSCTSFSAHADMLAEQLDCIGDPPCHANAFGKPQPSAATNLQPQAATARQPRALCSLPN